MKQDILSGDYFEKYKAHQTAPVDATSTGIRTVDAVCRDAGGGVGIGRGWFWVLAAASGGGKSVLSLNFIASALKNGEPVGLASLEMSNEQVATRLYSIITKTPINKLEHGGFNSRTWDEVRGELGDLPPVYVPERLLSSYQSVIEYAEECYDSGCRYIVVDYLQLIDSGVTEEGIYQSTQRVVTALRAFAVDKGCTVLCLSQFNRATSANYDESPRATSLHGGMIIEASADIVLVVDHSKTKRAGITQNRLLTYLDVAKSRHGPLVSVPIEISLSDLTVREADPLEEEEEWPR
jgi:replicative DNA helicase